MSGRRVVPLLAALFLPAVAMADPPPDLREACRVLARHVPAADVEYRPGVDGRGRAVAPADMPGSYEATSVTPRVEFKLSPDLVAPFVATLPASTRAMLGEGIPGRIAVEGDSVYYNSVLLNDVAKSDVVVLCR